MFHLLFFLFGVTGSQWFGRGDQKNRSHFLCTVSLHPLGFKRNFSSISQIWIYFSQGLRPWGFNMIAEVFFFWDHKCIVLMSLYFFPQCVFGPGIQGGIDRGCIWRLIIKNWLEFLWIKCSNVRIMNCLLPSNIDPSTWAATDHLSREGKLYGFGKLAKHTPKRGAFFNGFWKGEWILQACV